MTNKQYKLVEGNMVELSATEIEQIIKLETLEKDKVNLLKVRDEREPLLQEADYKINTLVDNNQDASAWRTYRQELRDITKASDLDNVTWPTKPS